jgi:cyclic-di-AMP phosphodiesterase PgpH
VNRGSRFDRGRADGALTALSKPPEKRWPDGALHHGARVGVLLLLAFAVTLFFPPATGPDMGRYEVGMVADEDIIALLTFGVPKNREELERERDAAAAAVPPTYEAYPDAVDEMSAEVLGFFQRLQQAASVEEGAEEAVGELLREEGIPATLSQRRRLLEPENRTVLARAAERAIRQILPRGVMDEGTRLEPAVGRILLVEPDGSERYVLRDSVLTTRQFFEEATNLLPPGSPAELDELLRLTLIRFQNTTLRYDAVSTDRDREAARRAVPTTKATVLQGEAIVRAAQQVGETEVERLEAFEEALRAQGLLEDVGFRLGPFLGSVLLNLLLLGIFGSFVYLFRGEIYENFRWVLLHAALILAFAGTSGIIARNELPAELLPIAFVALATAVLWDGRVAIVLTAALAALAGAQVPFQSVHAWLPVFVGGSAAALSVRAVRRRAQTWLFIAIIAAAYVVVISTLGLVSERDPTRVAWGLAAAGGNAVASAILAMGFLPVFEWFTRITTDQTLLEWADPNRPLLKRLSMEAPGTYAHTINVANLSESAANAIGANGLLCRVGVYYHDVGKMLKPQYFIENQPGARNPHDKLKPRTSAGIVREHVTEGIRLGREAKLPQILLDFIPEHHGTQEISFFFDKAKADLEDGEELDAEAFRYPGPKPRTRETAIVMLADSVESATRTVQDPTPARIRQLIDAIVDGKIRAGQLDEAPLTLQEITTIKDAFVKVLAGLYHHRIDYPETRHITEARGDGSGTPPAAEPEEEPEAAEDAPGGPPSGELASAGAAPERSESEPGEPARGEPTPEDAAQTAGAAAPRTTRPRGSRGPGSGTGREPEPSLFPPDEGGSGGEDGGR